MRWHTDMETYVWSIWVEALWKHTSHMCQSMWYVTHVGYFMHYSMHWWNSMMTSSKGNIFHFTGLLCGELTGHRWIPRAKASGAELWYFLWSGCANNREAGDLRRHCAHHDVSVMMYGQFVWKRCETIRATYSQSIWCYPRWLFHALQYALNEFIIVDQIADKNRFLVL